MSEKRKLLEAGEEENPILKMMAMAAGEVKRIREEMQTGEEVVEVGTNLLQGLNDLIEVDAAEVGVVKEEEEEEVVTAVEDAPALVKKDICLESVHKEDVEVIEVLEEATGLVILAEKRVTCLENALVEEAEMLEET